MSAEGPLGVVHIPKTGGAAVRAAFEGVSGCYTGPLYHDSSIIAGVSPSSLPAMTGEQFASVADIRRIGETHRMVMGHYAADFLIEGGCPQIAVQLREPRARLLSLYRYWQGLAPETIAGWGPWGESALRSAQLPLPAFLRTPGAWPATDNAVARHLLGHHPPAEASSARHQLQRELAGDGYQTVRRRIRIAEWSSESQRFADRLCTALDLDPVTVPRVNETSVSGAVQVIDADCRALLEELTSIDKSVIDRIISDGLVRARSPEDLDTEFGAAAEHLGFVVQ